MFVPVLSLVAIGEPIQASRPNICDKLCNEYRRAYCIFQVKQFVFQGENTITCEISFNYSLERFVNIFIGIKL
jgi:hypothetical protein